MTDTLVIEDMRTQDVPEAVSVHVRAFPGFFLTQLGPAFLRAFYAGVVADETGIALVARSESGVVGLVAGSTTPGGFYSRLLKRRWWRFAIASVPAIVRHPSIARRVAGAVRHPAEALTLQNQAGLFSIAVDPSVRGQGVGGRLLAEFVSFCRQQGSRSVRFETDAVGNEETIAFYEGRGGRVVRTYETPDGRRMLEYTLDIDATDGGHGG